MQPLYEGCTAALAQRVVFTLHIYVTREPKRHDTLWSSSGQIRNIVSCQQHWEMNEKQQTNGSGESQFIQWLTSIGLASRGCLKEQLPVIALASI